MEPVFLVQLRLPGDDFQKLGRARHAVAESGFQLGGFEATFDEEPRRDGTREPDTLGAPDPLLHAGRAVLAGPEPASLAVRGLSILHQVLAIVLPPRVAADAHHHDKQNDRTDHDESDFQPGRHEHPARFSIASFYARNMIRAARSVIARRTREPAREQRSTSRWQLLDQNYTGAVRAEGGRCLLLALLRHHLGEPVMSASGGEAVVSKKYA